MVTGSRRQPCEDPPCGFNAPLFLCQPVPAVRLMPVSNRFAALAPRGDTHSMSAARHRPSVRQDLRICTGELLIAAGRELSVTAFRFQVSLRRPVSRGEPGGPAIWPVSPSSCSVPSLFVPTSAIAERDRSPQPPALNAVGYRELLAVPVDARRSSHFRVPAGPDRGHQKWEPTGSTTRTAQPGPAPDPILVTGLTVKSGTGATSAVPGGTARPRSLPRGRQCRTCQPVAVARPQSEASCRRIQQRWRGIALPACAPAYLRPGAYVP
jgi:hypothetical protein